MGFIRLGISLNWGSMLLMALGAQWYLLFNVIGGAQAIPNDLREMAASIGLRRAREWRALIGPGIFGPWVTGAITASGGAWNASIVSELVSWGNTTLTGQRTGRVHFRSDRQRRLAAHRPGSRTDERICGGSEPAGVETAV